MIQEEMDWRHDDLLLQTRAEYRTKFRMRIARLCHEENFGIAIW